MHQVLEDLQHAPCQEVVCIGNVALFAGISRRDVEEGRSMNKEERISFWRIHNMHHVSKWCALEKLPCLQALAVERGSSIKKSRSDVHHLSKCMCLKRCLLCRHQSQGC